MTRNFDLNPDVSAALRAHAAAEGRSVADVAGQLLSDGLADQPWPGFRLATGAEADHMREQLGRDFGDGVNLGASRASSAEGEAMTAGLDGVRRVLGLADPAPAPADAPPRLNLSGIDPSSSIGRALRGTW